MKEYIVRISRVYSVPEKYVTEREDLEEHMSEQDILEHRKSVAEDIAMEWFSDEMDEFINNPRDFASPKVIGIYDENEGNKCQE